MRIVLILVAVACLSACGRSGKRFSPGPNAQKEIQAALIQAKPGETIFFEEGTFDFTASLTIDGAKNLTLEGASKEKTIFNFKGQTSGSEGIAAKNCQGLVIANLSVMDTKGDAIKVQETNGVIFRHVHTGWSGEPDSSNGAYGFYPVTCKNVLIEVCSAKGASDAGIYVGQSENIVVRNCTAEYNVAGIEIENSSNAEVFDNVSTHNTGGILVFDMPELPVRSKGNIRVFNNKCIANNTPNFAPKGNVVGTVPAGTGIIITANHYVDIFNNELTDNNTVQIAMVNYELTERPYKDPNYDPFPYGITIVDNKISRGQSVPDTNTVMGKVYNEITKVAKMSPDIIWDGMTNGKIANPDGSLPADKNICIQNNGKATFLNIKLLEEGPDKFASLKPHDCHQSHTTPVKLEGVK